MGYKIEKHDRTVPATGAFAVTPHDTNELATYSRALYIGTAGDITVRMVGEGGSTNVLFQNVPVGILDIEVKLVLSTGTAASDIVALF